MDKLALAKAFSIICEEYSFCPKHLRHLYSVFFLLDHFLLSLQCVLSPDVFCHIYGVFFLLQLLLCLVARVPEGFAWLQTVSLRMHPSIISTIISCTWIIHFWHTKWWVGWSSLIQTCIHIHTLVCCDCTFYLYSLCICYILRVCVCVCVCVVVKVLNEPEHLQTKERILNTWITAWNE